MHLPACFHHSSSATLAHVAIDVCKYHQGVLLLQGWLRPATGTARAVQPLKVVVHGNRRGRRWQLEIPADLERHDVPQVDDRQPVGFFFYGPAESQPEKVMVCSATAEQMIYRFHASSRLMHLALRAKPWASLARRGLTLLRTGQWSALYDKSRRHLGALFSRQAAAPSALGDSLQSRADLLVVDHDLGGGANQYRHTLVAEAQVRGESVAVLSYSLLRLRYHLRLFPADGRPQSLGLLDTDAALSLLRDHAPPRLLFNNAASFPEALCFAQALADYKKRDPRRHLTFAVHDYFALCPSAHLLDADGRFCDLPADPQRCARCLADNQSGFVPLYRRHDLPAWRKTFGAALKAADEIRTFSPSSGSLLKRVYADLPERKVHLIPHSVPPLEASQQQAVAHWRARRAPSGRILVVGSINDVKGAKVVASLLAAIDRANLPYCIRVVGSVTPRPVAVAERYAETGPYRREELTEQVLAADPDLLLLPSIVPETFSYVLHEMARYELPIAAYDIGAQADFLHSYPEAIMLPYAADGDDLLNALLPRLPQHP